MSIATLADVADIKARIAERDAAEAQASADYAEGVCPYVRPLLKVAESYVDFIQNPQGRIMFGVHDLDLMMRGIGRGELAFIFGQLHQGKTQLLLNIIAHNHDKRILYFTPDEMAEEVFIKLTAIRQRIDIEEFEKQIKRGEEDAVELLRHSATRDFPNLAIVDEGMGFKKLNEVRLQQEEVWGKPCELVAIDYLGVIPGYQDEGQAAKAVKGFAKNERQRVICLQQGHKDQSKRGKFQGVHGMLYGGQNEATFIVEVVRPGDDMYKSDNERSALSEVLSWRLWKNKRPPCKKGAGKLYLHPKFGATEPWGPEHMVATGQASTTSAVVAAAANNIRQLRSTS